MADDLRRIFLQLGLQDGGKFVGDPAVIDLAAGGDDAHLFLMKGQHLEDRRLPHCGPGPVHLLLLNDQRNHPGAGQLVSLLDGKSAVAAGDHHLPQAVYRIQLGPVSHKETVQVGHQLNFALLHRCRVHIVPLADLAENLRPLVLVEHALRLLPDVEVLLAHREQHGNVLLPDHMTLAEDGVLGDAGDDLGDIMAEDMAHCLGRLNQFHRVPLPRLIYWPA